MKKGFTLLETLIAITLVSVSLLGLYKTFTSLIIISNKNLLYDDASNIYKAYYIKEYLSLNNLDSLLTDNDITKVSCANFSFNSCGTLLSKLNVSNIYIAKYDLKEYDKDKYSATLNEYLNYVSKNENYKYRFIVEFKREETYSYAYIGIEGDTHE